MMDIPFESAVQLHGAMVFRICRTILLSEQDAQDAWSEVFLSALKHWDTLEEETRIEAWLVRVAQHKSIDIIRARKKQVTMRAGNPEIPAIASVESNGSDLWQLVARLPEKQRMAIAYHYFAGFSHKETAEIIGSNPVAVRRAAADGVHNLRKLMQQDLKHDKNARDISDLRDANAISGEIGI